MHHMHASLIILDGRHRGRKIELPRTQFVIGRDPKCHLRPASRRVSRFHCVLALRDDGLIVRDLKSQNGTFINGQQLEGTARLSAGDVLQIAGVKFEVQLETEPERPSRRYSGLLWLLDQNQTAEQDASVPTCQTVFALDVLDGGPADAGPAEQSLSDDTLVAGDYLHDYVTRLGLKR